MLLILAKRSKGGNITDRYVPAVNEENRYMGLRTEEITPTLLYRISFKDLSTPRLCLKISELFMLGRMLN